MFEPVEGFVDDKTLESSNARYSDKLTPRTGGKIKENAENGPAEVKRAIDSAAEASDAWRDMRPSERGRILDELGRLIRADGKHLAEIESLETGKPGHEMPALIDLTAQFFEFYGGIVNVMDGEVINQGPDYHVCTRRDPFGAIGVILPWNSPLHQAARAIVPALATGNTVGAKPSEQTPGSLVELARLAINAGVPAGVLNIILGSVRAGRELGAIAADRILPLTLELGGKSANIVFDDCGLDAAATG
jgi:aldehyde dehydrogenase (NAD+)